MALPLPLDDPMNYDNRIRIQAEKAGRTGFLWTLGTGLAQIIVNLTWLASLAGIVWAAYHFRSYFQ